MSDSMKFRSPRQEPKVTNIKPTRMTSLEKLTGTPNVSCKVWYRNFSGLTVEVLDRHGLCVPVKSEMPDPKQRMEDQRPVLKVYVEYTFTGKLVEEVSVPFVEDAEEELGAEARHINDFLKAVQAARQSTFSNQPEYLTFVYDIDPKQILENDGAVYFERIDLLVRTKGGESALHPYSAMGRNERLVRSLKEADPGALFGIRIVDNRNMIGPLYLRVANHVLLIKPRKDSDLDDGIYLSSIGQATGNDDESRRYLGEGLDYYSPGDARIQTVLRLWPTYREALHDMEIKDLVQIEMRREDEDRRGREEEARHRRDMERAESDRQMQEMKTKHLEEQIKRDQEKHTQDMEATATKSAAEIENQNQKKKYEQDSHELAKQREWLKFVTPVIGMLTVIISTVATIMQLRKSSSLVKFGSCLI